MKRTTLTAARRRTNSRSASGHHRRSLGFEPLERRDLLAVALAGVQAVDLWQMALDISHTTNQGEILSQTAANLTFTGSSAQASQNFSVDWGDHSTVYQGTFNAGSTASTTHTFSSGAFTVTVTCGAERHPLSVAIERDRPRPGGRREPSATDSIFIVGNNQANVVYARMAGGTLQVGITNPNCQRSFSSQAVAAIYGSLAGGNDVVTLAANVTQPAFFSLGDGNDYFVGGGGPDTVLGGNGNDVIFGGKGNNAILGDAGNDWLYAGSGNDVLYGGSGNDYIFAGKGNDMLFGGDGNDVIYGGSGTDLLEGDNGNDTLVAGSGNTCLYGGAGNDTLIAGRGTDWLFGGDGNDRLYCGSGNDVAIGGAGADQIYGGSGSDILAGGYSFQLQYLVQASLNPILYTWTAHRQIPQQLTYNPAVPGSTRTWPSGTTAPPTLLVRGTGRTLFYTGQNDKILGQVRSGVDVKVATTAPTANATINYTTTSGIVNPSGTLGQTTTLLGRFGSDMNTIINQKLQLRKTIDFSDNPGGFQVLNVPDSLYITSAQFWTDFNQPFLQQSIARNDVILGTTTPSSGGGYGKEIAFLQSNGYTYHSELKKPRLRSREKRNIADDPGGGGKKRRKEQPNQDRVQPRIKLGKNMTSLIIINLSNRESDCPRVPMPGWQRMPMQEWMIAMIHREGMRTTIRKS